MAEAAVAFQLEKLELILNHYIDLVPGAENELDQLKNELALLKSFLEEAAKKQKDKTFRELERQIRHIVYEAEDTIDTCVSAATAASGTAEAKKSRNPFKLRAKKAVDNPSKINLAEKVKSLREDKVKPSFERLKMLIANGSVQIVEQPSARVKKVPLTREDIEYFEDEEMTIVNYLMEATEELDVISIIGMPRLGKTTLAWKIFQNKIIKYEFPTRIWVEVSQEFNKRDMLLNILKAFTFEDMSSMSDNDLAQTVRAFLDRGKFLLVMDDVWTVEAWEVIRNLLPNNNWRGKVLITSRDVNVGRHANFNRRPYILRFLNEEESWELLQLEVFGKRFCPPPLERIGRYIASQCAGRPLAIVVMGGILLDLFTRKRAMNEIIYAWEDVSQNLSDYVKSSKGHDYDILNIIELSYNNLPDDLRECFLYLAIFPEDYQIPVWTLTRLWIAEGFILDQGQGLEKTAEDNLNDLINRNLVSVGETSVNGQLKTCRVHELIREFCIAKAAPLEQNLVQEIKMSAKQGGFVPPVSDIRKYRRLCVHSHLSTFLKLLEGTKGEHVRSFLCFCKEPVLLDGAHNSTIPDAFDLLRVLDSKSFKFDRFPIKVTKLIHLRYITLAWNDHDVLPQDTSKLWNLQTLVIETQSPTLRMEADIWKMIQLRHLKTKAAIILSAKSEGKGGENLQTLSRLSPDSCTQEVFTKARNLKSLGVRGHLDTLSDSTSLAVLDCLESLKLMNYLKDYSPSGKPMHSLPATKHFPPNIKRLTLSATCLGWEHMSILGEIANLQVLKLKEKAFTGHKWSVDGGFRALQFLLIATTDLVAWEASDDHFPSLTCLVLKNCEKLREIPLGLSKSLQVLEIERDIPKSAIESARKIEVTKKMQGSEKLRWGEFKLSIGPGCE